MTSPSITITKLVPSDWQTYKAIRLETLKTNPEAFSSTYSDAVHFSDAQWKAILSDKNNAFLVAKAASKVIGVARVAFNDPDEATATAVLCGLYITGQFRQLGVAAMLLAKRLELCTTTKKINRARAYIKAHNIPAIKLYKKFGFSELGQKAGELIMEKEL